MKWFSNFLCIQLVVFAAAMLTTHTVIAQGFGQSSVPGDDKLEFDQPRPQAEAEQEFGDPLLDSPNPRLPAEPLPGSPTLKPQLTKEPSDADLPSPRIDLPEETRIDGFVHKPTKSALAEIFEGDFSAMLPEGLARGPMTISVRRYQVVNDPSGKTQRMPALLQQTVDPHSPDLSAEQRLGVFISINESAIREKQQALFQADDAKAKEKLLGELRSLYATRFEIDTAYQDFKVREIERRAQKLRAEVNARQNASDDWVDAMLTLAKMRADGIETMDSLSNTSPPSFLNPAYGNNHQWNRNEASSYQIFGDQKSNDDNFVPNLQPPSLRFPSEPVADPRRPAIGVPQLPPSGPSSGFNVVE